MGENTKRDYWISPLGIELMVTNFLGYNKIEESFDEDGGLYIHIDKEPDPSIPDALVTLADCCDVKRITDPMQKKLCAMDTAVQFNEDLITHMIKFEKEFNKDYRKPSKSPLHQQARQQ